MDEYQSAMQVGMQQLRVCECTELVLDADSSCSLCLFVSQLASCTALASSSLRSDLIFLPILIVAIGLCSSIDGGVSFAARDVW